jgi:ribosomal protein L12E/L44/L45/RPP1/RPP2
MAGPGHPYDPYQIEALARVLAAAALDELLKEMTDEMSTAPADQGQRGAPKDLDHGKGTSL